MMKFIKSIFFKDDQKGFNWVYLVAVLFLFLWIRSLGEKNALRNEMNRFSDVMNDKVLTYENELGQLVSSKKALKGSEATLKMLLSSAIDNKEQLNSLTESFRKVASVTHIETETRIDTILIPVKIDAPPFDVPFSKNEEFYSLSGNITNSSLTIVGLTIPNTQTIVVGEKKENWFKTETRMEMVNSNPYVNTKSMDGYTHTERKKRFGLSLFVGGGYGPGGLGAIVGGGLSYSLIQF